MERQRLEVDRYLVDVLMPDLVGHDRRPAAFLVYLFLTASADPEGGRIELSLRSIAEGTGLSKRAVQDAIALLVRRRLVSTRKSRPTDRGIWAVLRPWRARRSSAA